MIERDIGRRAYTYDRCTPSRLLVPEKARKRDIARAKDNIFLFARIIVKFRRYSLFAPGNRSGPFGVFFCARLTKEGHRNSFYYTINDERGEKKKQYPAPGHDKRRANHITGILSAARSTLLFCFLFIEPFVLYWGLCAKDYFRSVAIYRLYNIFVLWITHVNFQALFINFRKELEEFLQIFVAIFVVKVRLFHMISFCWTLGWFRGCLRAPKIPPRISHVSRRSVDMFFRA